MFSDIIAGKMFYEVKAVLIVNVKGSLQLSQFMSIVNMEIKLQYFLRI